MGEGRPGPNGEDPSSGHWQFQSTGKGQQKKWKWKPPYPAGEMSKPASEMRNPDLPMEGRPGPNGEDPSSGHWQFQSTGKGQQKKWKWKPPYPSGEMPKAVKRKINR